MRMKTLVLATHSRGKIAELTALLAPIACIPQSDLHISEAAETGLTFVENALIKARHASHHSNYPALADDSGLVVDALNGRPGIYSARFAGSNATDAENIQKLLTVMQDLGTDNRHAYFYCATVLVRYPDDPTPIVTFGRLDGIIVQQSQGDQGFGYDPIFFLPKYGKTLAQLALQEKNKFSHRAQALEKLRLEFFNNETNGPAY
jgi:XTP/dITP diphosphohydrolase